DQQDDGLLPRDSHKHGRVAAAQSTADGCRCGPIFQLLDGGLGPGCLAHDGPREGDGEVGGGAEGLARCYPAPAPPPTEKPPAPRKRRRGGPWCSSTARPG